MTALDEKLEEIFSDSDKAITLLKAITAESKERAVEQKLAQAIVLLCNATGVIDPILEWALKHEVQNAIGQPNTLFRSNTMTVRMVADHIRHSASVYLVNTLHSPIHRILEHPKILSLDVEARYAEKVKPGEIRKRFVTLVGFADQLLNSIFESLEDSPRSLRRLLRLLYETVTEHFPSQGSMAVGGFVFLRFLCPAIVSPEKFFLTSKELEPEARRVLLLMSKTLIQLANEMEFSDSTLAPMNTFINDYQMLVVDWLVRFATQVSLGNEQSEGELGSGDHIEVMKVTKEARQASFEYIRWCVKEHQQSVCNNLPPQLGKELSFLLDENGADLTPIDVKVPLLDSHDKHYQLIKHAVFARSQLNHRHTLSFDPGAGKSPKTKGSKDSSKRRSLMAGMGKMRVKAPDSIRTSKEKDKDKDKDKDEKDADTYRVHNELLLIRVKELEGLVFEATGEPAPPAPYLQMFEKGALTAANLSLVQHMQAQNDGPLAMGSPRTNQSPRGRKLASSSGDLSSKSSPRGKPASPRTISLDAGGPRTISVDGAGGADNKKVAKDLNKVKKTTDAILEQLQKDAEWKEEVLARLRKLEQAGRPPSMSSSQ